MAVAERRRRATPGPAGSAASSSASAAAWRGPSGRPRRPLARRQARRPASRPSGVSADPALVARPGAGASSVQSSVTRPRVGEGAEPPDQRRPALGGDEVADRPRAALELVEQVAVGRRRGSAAGAAGGPLGEELEPLEQARRQHRPDDERRRGEVVVGDPAGEREGERRQQRPVGADPAGDRLRRRSRRRRRVAEDDAERLAPPELDEDRLAGLEVGELGRHDVGVAPRAAAAGGVDRDLDDAAASPSRPQSRRRRSASSDCVSPLGCWLAPAHGGVASDPDAAGRVAAMLLGDDRVDLRRPSARPGRSRW